MKYINKLFLTFLMVMLCSVTLAAVVNEPASMTDMPMPKFNLFIKHPSSLPHANNTAVVNTVLVKSKTNHIAKSVTIYPGSLKANVVRLAQSYGWKHIIWLSQDDYHWIGKVQVAAKNLPDILRQILSDYPLQADFYLGNRVLVIEPRTIRT